MTSQGKGVIILLLEDDPAHAEDRDAATEPMRRLQPGDFDTREFRNGEAR